MEYAKFDNTDVVQKPDELGLPLPWPFPKKLEKLTGTLTEFKAVLTKGPFEDRFYVRLAALVQEKPGGLTQEEISAVMLGAAGHGVAAFTSFNEGPKFQPAMYIFAELDGKPLRGWLEYSEFKISDEVEIIAEWTGGHYEVYAITRPKDEMITIYPECYEGFKAVRKIMPLGFLLVSSVLWMVLFLMVWPLQGDWWEAAYLSFTVAGVMVGIAGIGAYRSVKKTHVALAESIFSALGWKDVGSISLVLMSIKKIKQFKKERKEHVVWTLESYRNSDPSVKEKNLAERFYYDPDTVYGRKI